MCRLGSGSPCDQLAPQNLRRSPQDTRDKRQECYKLQTKAPKHLYDCFICMAWCKHISCLLWVSAVVGLRCAIHHLIHSRRHATFSKQAQCGHEWLAVAGPRGRFAHIRIHCASQPSLYHLTHLGVSKAPRKTWNHLGRTEG